MLVLDAAKTVGNIVLGLAPRLPGDGGFDLHGLTAEELARAIAADHPGARIDQVEVQAQVSGTTDRARLHLSWNQVGTDAGLPATVFVKGTPGGAEARVLNSAFGLAESEVRFYNEIQPDVADLTMRPYFARLGSGGRYLVALEDLGSGADVRFYTAGDEPPLTHTRGMMEELGKLHGRFWRSPRFATDLSWVTVYRRRPGYPFAHPIVRILTRKFLAQDRELPATVRRATAFYVDNRTALDRAYEALPATLIHGDCHTGNTFTKADGVSGFYDWQNIHKMNGLRDVAYYLGQSMSVESRRANEADLLERYLQSLADNGAGAEAPTYSQAYDTFRLLFFEGWLAAYATLALGGLQEADAMEIAAARCAQGMEDLDTEGAMRAAAARHGG